MRRHLADHGTAPDGRLFRGARGGILSESLYGRTWHAARAHGHDDTANQQIEQALRGLSPTVTASGLPHRCGARNVRQTSVTTEPARPMAHETRPSLPAALSPAWQSAAHHGSSVTGNRTRGTSEALTGSGPRMAHRHQEAVIGTARPAARATDITGTRKPPLTCGNYNHELVAGVGFEPT